MAKSSCPICRTPLRRDLDAALASDRYRNLRQLSRRFPRFTRHQLRRHRDICLGAMPKLLFLLRQGEPEEKIRTHLTEQGVEDGEITALFARAHRIMERAS